MLNGTLKKYSMYGKRDHNIWIPSGIDDGTIATLRHRWTDGHKIRSKLQNQQYRKRNLSRFNYRDHYTILLVSFAEIPKERSVRKENFLNGILKRLSTMLHCIW